jgi:DNA (cytosine-5)-methyltransferase 1
MSAYYNEIDPYCCAWLKNLMAAGLIPAGDVDSRSIVDVKPDDLTGYVQCHFFAGISGWAYAARLAGWPDDRPLWTGSCPCPPFSVAGKKKNCPQCGGGVVPCPRRTGYFICTVCEHAWFADGRHLWPEFWRLISELHPPVVMGEQVAGEDGRIWLAGVRASLELCGYSVGGADITSAGVGAPNIRSRLYWVADTNGGRLRERHAGQRAIPEPNQDSSSILRLDNPASARHREAGPEAMAALRDAARGEQPERRSRGGESSGLGNPDSSERWPDAEGRGDVHDGTDAGREETPGGSELAGAADRGMGHSESERCGEEGGLRSGPAAWATDAGQDCGLGNPHDSGPQARDIQPIRTEAGSEQFTESGLCGFWDHWELIGPDPEGKYRRIEPGLAPLVTRLPGHVQQIRAYGNAINPRLAAEVIRAYQDAILSAAGEVTL